MRSTQALSILPVSELTENSTNIDNSEKKNYSAPRERFFTLMARESF